MVDPDLCKGQLIITEDGYRARIWLDVSKAIAAVGRYRKRLKK